MAIDTAVSSPAVLGLCETIPYRWLEVAALCNLLHITVSFFFQVDHCVRMGTCIDVMEVMA